MSELLERLKGCASRIHLLDTDARTERQRRNSLLVAAIDAGLPYRAVARAAALSIARVANIIADPEK